MENSRPIFGNNLDSRDELLTTIVEQLVAEGLSLEEIERRLEAESPDAISKSGSILLSGLKASADDMFQDRRQIRQAFQEGQREKWGKPLDLLLMLIEAARETGEEYNASGKATPGVGQDYVFDVLRRLHARGCLIASEIHWMLEGGYASGAMARWRTLHELAAVGYFVVDHGHDTAERYLLHHQAEAFQAASQYNAHAHNLGLDPIPPKDLQRMQARRDALCQRFGDNYSYDLGWAAAALAPRRPTFAEIEKAVSLNHYRPYFKLASHANHAGSKGMWSDLGNAFAPPESGIMLAGPSDAGLADPGTCTATSLYQLTTNLILYRNITVSALIISNCLGELTEEIKDAFATAHEELVDQAETMGRQNSDERTPT